MLKNTPQQSKVKSTTKPKRAVAKKQHTVKKAAKKITAKRSFSTILTGNEDSFAPGRRQQAVKKPAAQEQQPAAATDAPAPPQQQQQQAASSPQQQIPQLDFNDPNVRQSVSAWNSFIRNKTSPIFQQTFQQLLVAYQVIPFPTDEDFKNPVGHIRKGLLNHGLVFEEGDERALPEDIIALQNEAKAKNKDVEHGSISTPTLFHLLDFFEIFSPQTEAEVTANVKYKPGLNNQFIPHKAGEFTTDPINFNAEQVKKKLAANQRLGLDASTIQQNSVLDIVAYCAEAAGGLDLREYVVTDNRPNSHVIFMEYLRHVPPPGDLLTSDFSDNTSFPFSPMHLQLFPDLAQSLNQITGALENEKSPQKLLQFSLQVSRRDVFAAWKKQNPELSTRFLQCGLNPLVGFNDDEMISVKGMILKQFIQNILVNKYLFEPFQNVYYTVNGDMANVQTQEQLGEYFSKKSNALAGVIEGDSDEIKSMKKQQRAINPEALGRMSRLTDGPHYQQIHSGKKQLVIQSIPDDQSTALVANFNEQMLTQGLLDQNKLRASFQERFPDAKTKPPSNDDMRGLVKTVLMDSMVKHGVLGKRQKKDDDAAVEFTKTGRAIIKPKYGANITTEMINNMDKLSGVKIVNPEDDANKEPILIKTFEQEIVQRLVRFGLLDQDNVNEYEINTLTPLLLPQDTEQDKKLKSLIMTKKLLPVNNNGITIATAPGEKPNPNELPTYTKILLAASMTERTGGDNDPESLVAIPVDEAEMLDLAGAGLISMVNKEKDTAQLEKIQAEQLSVQKQFESGITDPAQIQFDQSIRTIHIVAHSKENSKYPINGWVRNLENDMILADGTMLDVDRAIFKMNLDQLRTFSAKQFNHDVAMWITQREPDLFSTFTRDMHCRDLGELEMNLLRFVASQMATQSILKAKFRENQEMVDNGTLPVEDLSYHHVLFTTQDELKSSMEYFMDMSRFEKAPQRL